MKLLQRGYNEIQAVEVELRILEQTSAPPSRPRKYIFKNIYIFLLLLYYYIYNIFQAVKFKFFDERKFTQNISI